MNSDWKTPKEVRQTYASSSILKDNRIVFNIKGKSYRLVANFNFEKQWIFIRLIGTHSEYDKIDANKIKRQENEVKTDKIRIRLPESLEKP